MNDFTTKVICLQALLPQLCPSSLHLQKRNWQMMMQCPPRHLILGLPPSVTNNLECSDQGRGAHVHTNKGHKILYESGSTYSLLVTTLTWKHGDTFIKELLHYSMMTMANFLDASQFGLTGCQQQVLVLCVWYFPPKGQISKWDLERYWLSW